MDCQDYITESVEHKKGQHLQREDIISQRSSQNLLLPVIIPLDHDHNGIAGFEVRVLVVERVSAHDDRAVGEVAEHAA